MTLPSEIAFQQDTAGLYWLVGGEQQAGFRPSGDCDFGSEVTLVTSFEDPRGVWFWLDRAPPDSAVFADQLSQWLANNVQGDHQVLLWIDGAEHDNTCWSTHRVFMIPQPGGVAVLGKSTDFVLAGVRVSLPRYLIVDVNGEAPGFALHGANLTLTTEDGSFANQGTACVSYLPEYTGCLAWTLSLAAPREGLPTGLEKLGVSLRFFAPASSDADVSALRVAPLRQTGALTLHATFDPLAPFDPVRTRISLIPPRTQLAGPLPVFDSSYATTRGYGITLTPVNEATPTPPGFVLAAQPTAVGNPGDVPLAHYFTPDGDFALAPSGTSPPGTTPQLLCGVTGTEYVSLPENNVVLHFRAGGAAYMPAVPSILPRSSDDDDDDDDALVEPSALTSLGTTAWTWVSSTPLSARYCAQSDDAALFRPLGNSGYLSFLELPSIPLTSTDPAPAFPMLGYAGIDPADTALALALEAQGLAPERRRQIDLATTGQGHGDEPPPGEPVVAVSPSGLSIGFRGGDRPWEWLAIGNTGSLPDGLPDLRFTEVHGPFRQAIASARLFMVLSNADVVMSSASVAYELTPEDLGLIQALPDEAGVPDDVFAAVSEAVAAADTAGDQPYHTEAQFDEMLDDATEGLTFTSDNRRVFQRFAGLLTPVIDRWKFRISPRNWAGAERQTRLIFKFVTDRSLREMVRDTAAWNWPEAAVSERDEGLAKVSREILGIIRSAEQTAVLARAAGQTSPYDRFVQAVDDPKWTGVLALSVEVPLEQLPEALQPLAVGIEPGSFYGHHLALTTTGFTATEEGALQFDVTSSFGLIDYEDPVDQYFSSDVAFAFKVQRLAVGFENGLLSSFTSSSQLMVNRMFGADTRLEPTEHGNNIMFEGAYQAEGSSEEGKPGRYVFAMCQPGALQLSLSQLREVAVDSTRLVVTRSSDPADNETTVLAVFELAGRLRFHQPENDFDPFCWGPPRSAEEELEGALNEELDEELDALASRRGLTFSNYAITMKFSLSNPADVHFSVSDENLNLDTANSVPRENSLVARFPARLVGLLTTPDPALTGADASTHDPPLTEGDEKPGRLPEDAGFVSISAPIQQGRLSQPWYGLVYELDLGTLGALAGSVGITVRLLAAWSAGGSEHVEAVYFGAALPGIEDAVGVDLPLQGILDVGFRTLQFSTYPDEDGGVGYLLRLRDFGLRVLGLSFPPGNNDITLFANPDQTSSTKLGWYAAYDSGSSEAQTPGANTRQIRRARPARVHGSAREEG
ncbi:hemagglutinin protein [Planctomycetota bacterium]|nr:hemagglutinin protein [Planctomycetota bacterium]